MTKRLLFSTLLVVSSTVVLSACLPEKQENQNGVQNEKQEQAKEMEKDGSFSGSLKELVGFGKSQKCTWEDGESGVSGVTYTDGERSYSEINNIVVSGFGQANDNGEKGSMYTLYDGEYLYSWSSNSNEGMKMKDDEMMGDDEEYYGDEFEGEEFMYEDEEDSEYAESMETDYEYKCSSWRVDKSKFDFPKNIKFTDFAAMMNSFQEGFGDMSDVCSMLEGEDQEECIADWAKSQEQMKQMGQ